jgi:DNA-binding transcriptional MerR regulator
MVTHMAMTVDDLSRRTGVSTTTIRYYTRIGLLRPHRHPANRYRLFGEADVRRLAFVGKAKLLGLSLAEIREVIRMAEDGDRPCAHVRTIVARRAEQVRLEIESLRALHQDMAAALRQWETMPDVPHNGHSICPIIEGLVLERGAGQAGASPPQRTQLRPPR